VSLIKCGGCGQLREGADFVTYIGRQRSKRCRACVHGRPSQEHTESIAREQRRRRLEAMNVRMVPPRAPVRGGPLLAGYDP